MATYLYGIIRAAAADKAALPKADAPWGKGVGDPARPVYAVVLDDVAALVSQVEEREIGEAAGIRGLRRDMTAHSDLLNRVIATTTVLPVRLGVVLPDEEMLTDEILDPQYDQLVDYLDRLEGAVEVTVRATYVEEAVLREVVADQPRLAQPLQGGRSRSAGRLYNERIETGRKIASALQAKRAKDQEWLSRRLGSLARNIAVGKAASDLMVMNASFLVDRKRLDRFDKGLAKVNEEVGNLIQFDCIGPLPPYSFATIRLPVNSRT